MAKVKHCTLELFKFGDLTDTYTLYKMPADFKLGDTLYYIGTEYKVAERYWAIRDSGIELTIKAVEIKN
jgi:hypothetical protein